MLISVSGYNGTGKSTLTQALAQRLAERGVPYRLCRFDAIYPSSFFSRKGTGVHQVNVQGEVGIRKITGQRGSWDRPCRWHHAVNTLAAMVGLLMIRLWYRRTVIIYDRYFYDRYVHFGREEWLYKLVEWLTPRPTLGFVLFPQPAVWEERLLKRLERRGVRLEALSEADRRELAHVRERYGDLCTRHPHLRRMSSTSGECIEAAWQAVRSILATSRRFYFQQNASTESQGQP